MNYKLAYTVPVFFLSCVSLAMGDTVQFTNGDNLSGKVRSLNEKELQLDSENFGKVTIPRAKIMAIYLGDARPPAAVSPTAATLGAAAAASAPAPNAAAATNRVEGILGRLLQNQPDIQDLPQNAARARDGLRSLRNDLGPGERDALDGYIKLFDLFAPPSPEGNAEAVEQ